MPAFVMARAMHWRECGSRGRQPKVHQAHGLSLAPPLHTAVGGPMTASDRDHDLGDLQCVTDLRDQPEMPSTMGEIRGWPTSR
jgi:hypothetical protein